MKNDSNSFVMMINMTMTYACTSGYIKGLRVI